MGCRSELQGGIEIHALINMDTNGITAYVLHGQDRDNTAFRMLTDTAFTKGHVLDTIYADLAYEAKEN